MKIGTTFKIKGITGSLIPKAIHIKRFEELVCSRCRISQQGKCKTNPQEGKLLTNKDTGEQKQVWTCDQHDPTTIVKLEHARQLLKRAIFKEEHPMWDKGDIESSVPLKITGMPQ